MLEGTSTLCQTCLGSSIPLPFRGDRAPGRPAQVRNEACVCAQRRHGHTPRSTAGFLEPIARRPRLDQVADRAAARIPLGRLPDASHNSALRRAEDPRRGLRAIAAARTRDLAIRQPGPPGPSAASHWFISTGLLNARPLPPADNGEPSTAWNITAPGGNPGGIVNRVRAPLVPPLQRAARCCSTSRCPAPGTSTRRLGRTCGRTRATPRTAPATQAAPASRRLQPVPCRGSARSSPRSSATSRPRSPSSAWAARSSGREAIGLRACYNCRPPSTVKSWPVT